MHSLLIQTGLPIYLNNTNMRLAFEAPVNYLGFGTKDLQAMDGLLIDVTSSDPKETIYEVYRGICLPEDKAVFEKNRYRYDITVVMPGQVGRECKKTSGHYHLFNPTGTNTYPEVYEVLKGTAVYILQKSSNFIRHDEPLKVEDLFFVKVHEGEALLVPPNYGHCSINVGNGPMIFSNLAYVPCSIDYLPVLNNCGMSYFFTKENGQINFVRNESYEQLPEPQLARVKENKKFGINFGKSVYQSYIENPAAFAFLGQVDGHEDEIMNMLEIKDANTW